MLCGSGSPKTTKASASVRPLSSRRVNIDTLAMANASHRTECGSAFGSKVEALARANVPESSLALINEIGQCLTLAGWHEHHECIAVARTAFRFLGLPYGRSEDFSENFIDCSTLTSQSHWEGALVGIPFIAENQRIGASGVDIAELSRVIPGDVVVKFRGLDDTTDNHNHVALVLGRDVAGQLWLIESCAKVGARVISLEEFTPAAGIRRYLPSPDACFDTGEAVAALALAGCVPKLGRFYARQHAVDGRRIRHEGVDIYCPANSNVFAPMEGNVAIGRLPRESNPLITITDQNTRACCILGNVRPFPGIEDGVHVTAQDCVGFVVEPSPGSEIRYVTQADGTSSHLHVAFTCEGLSLGNSVLINGRTYHNALYACKLGILQVPIHISR